MKFFYLSCCLFLSLSSFAARNLKSERELRKFSYQGNYQEIDILLEDLLYSKNKKNFNINSTNKNGDTALIIAAFKSNYKAIRVLVNYKRDFHLNLESLNQYGDSALSLASYKACYKCVKALVRAGAKIQNIGPRKINALDVLLNTRNSSDKKNLNKIANYLISLNINIHYRDKNRSSLLLKALFKDLTPLAKTLIEQGVRFNSKNNQGFTPTMIAARDNNSEILEMLINNNAYLDIKNNNGLTAFMLAVLNNSTTTMQMLLDEDIDTSLQNNDGKDALLLAAENNHKKIYNYLVYKGINSYNKSKASSIIKTFKELDNSYADLKRLTNNAIIANISSRYGNFKQNLESSGNSHLEFSTVNTRTCYQYNETYNFSYPLPGDMQKQYLSFRTDKNSLRAFKIIFSTNQDDVNFPGIILSFNTDASRQKWYKTLKKTRNAYRKLQDLKVIELGTFGTSGGFLNCHSK